MTVWFPVVEGVAAIAAVTLMYSELGSFRHRKWYVSLTTVIGWSLAFAAILLIPNDIITVRS